MNDIQRNQLEFAFRLPAIQARFPNFKYAVADSAACCLSTINLVRESDLHLITRVPDQKSTVQNAIKTFNNGEIQLSTMIVNEGKDSETECYAWLPNYTMHVKDGEVPVYKPVLFKAESLRSQKTETIPKRADKE